MKIVHTADLHIGMETHGPVDPHTGLPRRLEDFLGSLDAIVDTAIAERADLVIIAGDIYKNREPNPTHQRGFAQRVLRLAQERIPVFLLAGNHDLPNAASRATSIDIFGELKVPGVVVGRRADVFRIDTASGPALVAALPWQTRTALLTGEQYRSLSTEEMERALVTVISDTAANLAEEVDDLRGRAELADAPAILVAHVHAWEAKDGAERSLTVGTDPLVPIGSLARESFDYVALGHMHAHQRLHEHPPAVYPGSIQRVNFGEETEDKGFVVAELARGSCSWEFRQLAVRSFLTINVKAPTDDPTEATLRQIERQRDRIPEAVVRVRVQMSVQNQALFDEPRVRAALADAFWVSEIYRDVDRPTRLRVAGMTVEGKGPLELLDDYLAQKQVPNDTRERLRAYATRLVQGSA